MRSGRILRARYSRELPVCSSRGPCACRLSPKSSPSPPFLFLYLSQTRVCEVRRLEEVASAEVLVEQQLEVHIPEVIINEVHLNIQRTHSSFPSLSLALIHLSIIDVLFLGSSRHTNITYLEEPSGKLKRITKAMSGIIIELCTRNKTEETGNGLEEVYIEYASLSLHTLAVAFEGDDAEAEGNGFQRIGLLAIFNPLPPVPIPSRPSTMPLLSVFKYGLAPGVKDTSLVEMMIVKCLEGLSHLYAMIGATDACR
ncbi:hypothetical protein BDQ17DRAFT_1432366 [Cyathus striatus]|nr:hypothetical protein BDQ17DRAFT_1432366 [Cyathus striatus]